MKEVTSKQTEAAFTVVRGVADCIKEMGEVPSGLLYANLCGIMSLDSYETIIDILLNSGVIVKQSHILRWVGEQDN